MTLDIKRIDDIKVEDREKKVQGWKIKEEDRENSRKD